MGKFLHVSAECADSVRLKWLCILRSDEFEAFYMKETWNIDRMARQLAALVPPGLADAREDLGGHFRDVLMQGLRRLNLVTREEFDVQLQLLARTRLKVDVLEKRVAELEAVMKRTES